MENLLELVDELTSKIKNSSCYKDYLISKENIQKDTELYSKICDFKKIHTEFQKKKHNGEYISLDYEKDISKRYHNLILNNDAKIFLENEKALIKLIGNIYNKITTDCIFELDIL